MKLNKDQMVSLFEKINRNGVLVEAGEMKLNYVLRQFACSMAINRGIFYISIYHNLSRNIIPDTEILNRLNQVVPFGNHTIEQEKDDKYVYHFRGFLPIKLDLQELLEPSSETIDYLTDAKERCEVAAAGGYKLLARSHVYKNTRYEFLQYREWINDPSFFPCQFFDN